MSEDLTTARMVLAYAAGAGAMAHRGPVVAGEFVQAVELVLGELTRLTEEVATLRTESGWIPYTGNWDAFRTAGLAVPGVRITVDGRDYLIGDINELAGVCDDCTAFGLRAVVTRYAPAEVKP